MIGLPFVIGSLKEESRTQNLLPDILDPKKKEGLMQMQKSKYVIEYSEQYMLKHE